ncbi:MAG: cytochrome c peroxidase, partial [Bacteroidota bacterium]
TLSLDQEQNVWVANQDDATVSVVSKEGELLSNIVLPYASRPYGICISPDHHFALVTLQGTGKVLKISTLTREVVQGAAIHATPRGIAITHDGQQAYISRFVSAQNRGEVEVLNTSDLSSLANVTLQIDTTPDSDRNGRGVPNFVSALTISPDGESLWVPSKKDNVERGHGRDGMALDFDNTVRSIASVIDIGTQREVFDRRIDFNDSELACAVEFSPFGNLAFVALQGNNRIEFVNAYTNARVGRITDTGLAPQGLVFNKDGSRLYVHNFMSRTVRVFDTERIIASASLNSEVLATISTVSNEALPEQVLMGKKVFYNAADTRMSKAGYMSCATCHLDGESDERVWDFTQRGEGFRNTHSLLGRGGTALGRVHWTGNFDEIQDFENEIRSEFGGSGFMSDEDFEAGSTSDPLGDPKAGGSPDLDALAAYLNSLDRALPSPYKNEDGTLTDQGLKGQAIFRRLQCNSCHSGENFTDKESFQLHDVGTITTSSGQRIGQTLEGFVTPPLKGLWHTAPFLHDGSAATLKDVLVSANKEEKHGQTGDLSEEELDQLVSYLLQIDVDETENDLVVTSTASQSDGTNPLIYPNPTENMIHLGQPIKSNWVITNLSGKVFMTGTSRTIILDQLNAGLYLLTVNGKAEKFIKR